jgi:predicted transcriptional regulator
MKIENKEELLKLTVQIVAAHVSKNAVPVTDLPSLIVQVHGALASLGDVELTLTAASMTERPQPAVSIKKSVTDAFLICLEDGRKLKMLKRHLHTAYGMTPAQYRERWGLPADYPMAAPDYAKRRSDLAKANGLGNTSGGRRKHAAA